jgi:hypothetical protein
MTASRSPLTTKVKSSSRSAHPCCAAYGDSEVCGWPGRSGIALTPSPTIGDYRPSARAAHGLWSSLPCGVTGVYLTSPPPRPPARSRVVPLGEAAPAKTSAWEAGDSHSTRSTNGIPQLVMTCRKVRRPEAWARSLAAASLTGFGRPRDAAGESAIDQDSASQEARPASVSRLSTTACRPCPAWCAERRIRRKRDVSAAASAIDCPRDRCS